MIKNMREIKQKLSLFKVFQTLKRIVDHPIGLPLQTFKVDNSKKTKMIKEMLKEKKEEDEVLDEELEDDESKITYNLDDEKDDMLVNIFETIAPSFHTCSYTSALESLNGVFNAMYKPMKEEEEFSSINNSASTSSNSASLGSNQDSYIIDLCSDSDSEQHIDSNPNDKNEKKNIKENDKEQELNGNNKQIEKHWWYEELNKNNIDNYYLKHSDLIFMSTKMYLFLKILYYSVLNNEKVLFFTQSLYVLDVLEEILQQKDWGSFILSKKIQEEKRKKKNQLNEKLDQKSKKMKFSKDVTIDYNEDEENCENIEYDEHIEKFSSWKSLNNVDNPQSNQRYYGRIDGSSTNRQSIINNFSSSPSASLLLLSTKACNMGVNIPCSTRLVLFDVSMNPTDDSQAICRSYRLGLKEKLFVYRFVSSSADPNENEEEDINDEDIEEDDEIYDRLKAKKSNFHSSGPSDTLEEIMMKRQLLKYSLSMSILDGKSISSINDKKKSNLSDENYDDYEELNRNLDDKNDINSVVTSTISNRNEMKLENIKISISDLSNSVNSSINVRRKKDLIRENKRKNESLIKEDEDLSLFFFYKLSKKKELKLFTMKEYIKYHQLTKSQTSSSLSSNEEVIVDEVLLKIIDDCIFHNIDIFNSITDFEDHFSTNSSTNDADLEEYYTMYNLYQHELNSLSSSNFKDIKSSTSSFSSDPSTNSRIQYTIEDCINESDVFLPSSTGFDNFYPVSSNNSKITSSSVYQLDLTKEEDIQAVVDEVRQEHNNEKRNEINHVELPLPHEFLNN